MNLVSFTYEETVALREVMALSPSAEAARGARGGGRFVTLGPAKGETRA